MSALKHKNVNFLHILFLLAYTSDALLPIRDAQPPNELLNFIEKQENYIEQLEKESNFCRVSDQSKIFENSPNCVTHTHSHKNITILSHTGRIKLTHD